MRMRSDIAFEMIDDLSGETVVTVEIKTPAGTLLVMGEVAIEGERSSRMACTCTVSAPALEHSERPC